MIELKQGYNIGKPRPKFHAREWIKDNKIFLIKLLFILVIVWLFAYWIGATARQDAYERDARADCYGSQGQYADVGFGDDLCYKDGKVIQVYQA